MNGFKCNLAMLIMSGALCSCSYLDIGESEYSCPGKKYGVTCAGTRDIYNHTHNGRIPAGVPIEEARSGASTFESGEIKNNAGAYGNGSGISDSAGEQRQQVVENFVTPNLPDKPVPVRTPARVMRIWVAPWEDRDGDLNVSGYIYTEIEARKWVISEPHNGTENSFDSLK